MDRAAEPPGVVLVVEDSDEDYEATFRALTRAAVGYPVRRCRTGAEALDYLHGRGAYHGVPSAVLVLLDLNLPGFGGHTVLERIKSDARTRVVPVVVLTTSSSQRDVVDCYRGGANSYMVKSVDFSRFVEGVAALAAYWLGAVLLPPRSE